MSFITNILGGGGSGTSVPVFVPNASNASAGMVAVPAGNPANTDQVTVGTTAARAAYNAPVGIYAFTAFAGIPALLYLPGMRVPASVTALGAGTATLVVATSTGALARKDLPDAGDMVVGTCDASGVLHFIPLLLSGVADATNPSLRGANDASADAGITIQKRVDAAMQFGPGDGFNGQGSKQVVIEPGNFIFTQPLHICRGQTVVGGASDGSTHVTASNFAGTLFFTSPFREPPFLAFNDFAGGNGMILDQPAGNNNTLRRWLEVSEYGAGCLVNGWSAIEIRFIIKKTSAAAIGAATIIASGGSRYGSDPGGQTGDTRLQNAFAIHLTGNADTPANAILFQLTTSTTQYNLYSSASALTVDGNAHYVICNYSAGTVRIFVDGVLVGSMAATGTVKQYPWEQTVIGNGVPLQYNNNWNTGSAYGNLYCLEIANAVSQTSSGSLTLPVAKFAYPPSGNNISLALNWDDYYPTVQAINITNVTNTNPMVVTTAAPHGLTGPVPYPFSIQEVGGCTAANNSWTSSVVIDATHIQLGGAGNGAYTSGGKLVIGGTFVKGYTAQSGASPAPRVLAYFPTIHDNVGIGLTPTVEIRDLTLTSQWGDAAVFIDSPRSRISRVVSACKGGVRLLYNCYESVIDKLSVQHSVASADRRVACLLGSADYMSKIRNVDFVGCEVGIVAVNTDIAIDSAYLNGCARAAMFYECTNIEWTGMTSISDEGSPANWTDDQVAIIGCSTVHISATQISAPSNICHNIVIDQVGTTSSNHNTYVKLDAGFIAAATGSAGNILAKAGPALPLTGACEIILSTKGNDVTIPYIDPASATGYPVVVKPLRDYGTKSIALSDADYTMTRDDALANAITFTGALTADRAITYVGPNIGSTYFLNATTGGHNLTLVKSGGTNVLTIAVSPAATLVRNDGTDVRSP